MGDKDFPHLGFDPAPGDVDDTLQLARALDKLADELGTTMTELELIDGGRRKGKAATAFTEHVAEDMAPDMERAHASFDKAATALRRWAADLDRFQDEAQGLERQAAAEAAGDALESVRKRAERLRERYFRAADAICRHLDTAADTAAHIAPDEPGPSDRIAGGVPDVLGDAPEWVQDHADLIKAIGDITSDASAALTMLAISTAPSPPIGTAFASTTPAYAPANAAGADLTWARRGGDALGVLPRMGQFSLDGRFSMAPTSAVRNDPLSAGGRLIDASTKLAPKLAGPFSQHAEGAVDDLGDRFQAACGQPDS